MGKSISYCYKCSTLLREDDFARGKAVRLADHVACAACAPEAVPPPPPPPVRESASSPRISAPKPPGVSPGTRRAVRPAAPDRNKVLLGAIGGGAILIVILILVMSGGNRNKETPAEISTPAPTPAPVRPAADPARDALDAARRWAKAHPNDLAGRQREFQKVALEWDKTPSGKEAIQETAKIKAEILTKVAATMEALEKELQPALDKKDFAAAAAILDGAQKRLDLPDWEFALSKRAGEIRELKKQHESKVAEGLVGHWTLDGNAEDSSGNGHTGKVVGKVEWVPGKVGGGLRLDGGGGHLELPRSELLDHVQENTFTLAAWFKPDDLPPGKGDANDAAYGILIKAGHHEGLLYSRAGHFQVDHWLEGNAYVGSGSWTQSFPPGAFHHVTSIVDKGAGSTQIWVDGQLNHTSPWKAGTATRDFGGEHWRIGLGWPSGTKWGYLAKGIIDDVRIYSRALTAEEIRNLVEMGR